jgi:hypothetical protein
VIVGVALDGLGEEFDGFLVALGFEGFVSFVFVFCGLLAHKRYISRTLFILTYKAKSSSIFLSHRSFSGTHR